MHIFFPVLYAVHTGNSSCQERYLLTVPESKLIFSFNRTSRQTGYYTTQRILFMGRTRRTKRLTQVREHWNIASLRRPHVWPYLAPVPLTPFLMNSKFHQNVECCNLKYIQPITMKFCTHHDSYIVVTCAKLRCADATGTIESILQECTRPIWAIFIYIIIWWFCSQWSSGPTVSSRDMGMYHLWDFLIQISVFLRTCYLHKMSGSLPHVQNFLIEVIWRVCMWLFTSIF